jgi:hypothetical protein
MIIIKFICWQFTNCKLSIELIFIINSSSNYLQINSSVHERLYSLSHSTDSFGLALGPDTIDKMCHTHNSGLP